MNVKGADDSEHGGTGMDAQARILYKEYSRRTSFFVDRALVLSQPGIAVDHVQEHERGEDRDAAHRGEGYAGFACKVVSETNGIE